MKRLEDSDVQNMIERSRQSKCAECGEALEGKGRCVSVPGYPKNLWFSEACLNSITEALTPSP